MLKMSDNPPMLFPEDCAFDGEHGQWWVAHTKARNEKALAWTLAGNEVEYFLPMREKVGVRKGRKHKSLLPLFSGYVFFFGGPEQRHIALRSNRIAQVIEVADQAGLKKELSRIYEAIRSGLPVNLHPGLDRGDWCRVKAGPLVGMEGHFLRRANVCHLVLEVSILGQAAAVEIDTDQIELIDN